MFAESIFEDLQLINWVLPVRVFLGCKRRVPRMKGPAPEPDLHVPGSAAIFAVFVGSGWVNPRDPQTPEG